MAARRTTKTTTSATDAATPTGDLSTDQFVKFLLGLKNLIDDHLVTAVGGPTPPSDPPFDADKPAAKGGTKRTRTPEPDPEEVEDEDDDDPQAARRAELEKKTLKHLQKIYTTPIGVV